MPGSDRIEYRTLQKKRHGMPSDATQKAHMLSARLVALDKQSDESSDTGNFRLPVRSIAGAVLVSGDDSSLKRAPPSSSRALRPRLPTRPASATANVTVLDSGDSGVLSLTVVTSTRLPVAAAGSGPLRSSLILGGALTSSQREPAAEKTWRPATGSFATGVIRT